MRLTLLGTGSALPSPTRLQTGAVVQHAESTLLVDCGSGTAHRLVQSAIAYRDVDTPPNAHTSITLQTFILSPRPACSTATTRSRSSARREPGTSVTRYHRRRPRRATNLHHSWTFSRHGSVHD